MKKITSIIALIATSFFATAQNVDYNFNTEGDIEGFTQSGSTATVPAPGGVLEITFTGGYAGVRGPEGENINESDYQYVVVNAENATNNTEWQIVSLDSGDTNFGNGEKTNFTMPVVADGAGYTSFVIAIPINADNSGIIDRIGLRAKTGTAPTGTLRIDRLTIIEAENDFVTNAGFESMVSSVTPWTTSGGEISVVSTSTVSEGTQAAEITFDADQTKNQFLDNVVYDFGKTITPDNINATFDVRATNTNVEFQVQYDLLDENDANVGTPNTGLSSVSVVDTYEPFEFNKTNTVSFNKIRFRFKIKTATGKNAVSGDKFFLDNVKVNLTDTTLSQKELEKQINFGLYPNPVSDILNINVDAEVKTIEVLNLIGQVVATSINSTSIKVTNLQSGVYIARVVTDKGVIAKRIIKD